MDAREKRVGKNEALFRRVNERLKEVGESFSHVAETATFVCECGDASCAEPVMMTLEEYERVRADPTHFFVKPGHEHDAIEEVIERHDGYVVVLKATGGPAGLAIKEDPRRG